MKKEANQQKIRNFAIIAHIDHGKSTLADRLMERTGAISARQMKDRLLDTMDLEQEKGITIKLATVSLFYQDYWLNLIDTPGHVDFNYEVSRSLLACEGVLLVVDASQGIQAQTLANVQLAKQHNLKIIPVVNKIDLPAAEVEQVSADMVDLLGVDKDQIIPVSGKTGENVEAILEAVVDLIDAPVGDPNQPLQALIFDSFYDDFRGVVLYVRLMAGTIKSADSIMMIGSGQVAIASEIGWLQPEFKPTDKLTTGQIGYIVTNLKSIQAARVGDTVALNQSQLPKPLPGYQAATTFIFAGIFPVSRAEHVSLKKAIEKLALTDSALNYQPQNSTILGSGFRVGFLGLLHLEIITERLKREYSVEVITTNPSTVYKLELTNGDKITIKAANQMPEASTIQTIAEPWVEGEIICRTQDVGAVLNLLISVRGQQTDIKYLSAQTIVAFVAPLANLITNFYDKLKSQTNGYGSLSYQMTDYREQDLVRLDFLVAGELVSALSLICHRDEAVTIGRDLIIKLKDIIPRQQFKVAIQAAINNKIIARTDLSGFRKDVTAKLYGGDVSRRKKLLEKQKKGKSKMKKIGKVDIPADAFKLLIDRNFNSQD